MSIDDKLLADLAVCNLNYKIVCDLFGLSEVERLSPNAGAWIVDCIKQYQTSAVVAKAMKMRTNENQQVQNYTPPVSFPPNPLLSDPQATATPGTSLSNTSA